METFEFLVRVVAPRETTLFDLSHAMGGTAMLEGDGAATIYFECKHSEVIKAGYALTNDVEAHGGAVTHFITDVCDVHGLSSRLGLDFEAYLLLAMENPTGFIGFPLPSEWDDKGRPLWDWHDILRHFDERIETPRVPSRRENDYLNWWIKYCRGRLTEWSSTL